MGWSEKITNINDLILFCKEWKTREEIREQFELSSIEAWHCIKYCRSLYSDFETKTNIGATKRSYAIRTRQHVLDEISS